jgi:hypothetical protein
VSKNESCFGSALTSLQRNRSQLAVLPLVQRHAHGLLQQGGDLERVGGVMYVRVRRVHVYLRQQD